MSTAKRAIESELNQPREEVEAPENKPSEQAHQRFNSRLLSAQQQAQIARIKLQAEIIYDDIAAIPQENHESARLVSLAKTSLEETILWATKAISRA